MPDVAVSVAGATVDFAALGTPWKDLAKAEKNLLFVTNAIREGASLLSAVDDGDLATFSYDSGDGNSWDVGPVKFGVNGAVSAKVTLAKAGQLFEYYSDLANTNKVLMNVPTGQACVSVEMDFSLGAGVSGEGAIGPVKLSGSADGKTSFTVKNFRMFPLGTECGHAVLVALASFTLPLHATTADQLNDGDFLYYEFAGTLDVGFGASYGISTTVGGTSISELTGTTASQWAKLADLATSKGVTAGAKVGLAVDFKWTKDFSALLIKTPPVDDKASARLHLFSGSTAVRSVALDATGGISVGAPTATVDAEGLLNALLSKAVGKDVVVPSQILGDQYQKWMDAAEQGVKDFNAKVKSLQTIVNDHGEIALSVLFKNTKSNTSAFTWDFDLTHASFPDAWSAANHGDFVEALNTGAATLEEGSGFEQSHIRSTAFKFSFFGWKSTSTLVSFFSNSKVEYRGGVFLVSLKAGKAISTEGKDSTSSTTLYVEGVGTLRQDRTLVEGLKLELHGILTAKNNLKQSTLMGDVLTAVGLNVGGAGKNSCVVAGTLLKTMETTASSSSLAVSLHLKYDLAILKNLHSDPYDAHGNQTKGQHLQDADNWQSFEQSARTLKVDALMDPRFNGSSQTWASDYDAWIYFNCLTRQEVDLDGDINRDKNNRHSLPGIGANTPGFLSQHFGFGQVVPDVATALKLYSYFGAGQSYMNLCDDLKQMAQANGAFSLVDIYRKLNDIAQKDLDASFGPTILLALSRSTGANAAIVESGVVDVNAGTGEVIVRLALQ